MEEQNNNLMPELKDLIETIRRFNALHPEGRFIYAFIGFKKDEENICSECGDFCDCIDENKTIFGAFGYLDELRCLSNDLRDNIEDNVDEEGYVNF